MKLLTLNCHSWQEKQQLEKIKYIAKTIYENNYDVIALQEVSQLIDSNLVYDNIKESNFALLLDKELKQLGCNNYSFYFDISHIGYDIYEEGLCIFTKHPIKSKKSFVVSKNKSINSYKTRKIVKITIEYNNKDIDIYSCHLGWWSDNDECFKHQVDTLAENIGNNITFLMGDFNNDANISNEGYEYILKHNILDTYKLSKNKDLGITVKGKIDGWSNNTKDMRLDIIFTNNNIEVMNSNVIFNGENKNIVSDHFGVEIEVNL